MKGYYVKLKALKVLKSKEEVNNIFNVSNEFFISKVRNSCNITGKQRSVISFIKIGRNGLKIFYKNNLFYNLKKASWLILDYPYGGIGRHGSFKFFCFK